MNKIAVDQASYFSQHCCLPLQIPINPLSWRKRIKTYFPKNNWSNNWRRLRPRCPWTSGEIEADRVCSICCSPWATWTTGLVIFNIEQFNIGRAISCNAWKYGRWGPRSCSRYSRKQFHSRWDERIQIFNSRRQFVPFKYFHILLLFK